MYIRNLLLSLVLATFLTPCQSEAKRKKGSSKKTFQWHPVTEEDWSAGEEWFAKGHSAVMLFEKVVRDDKDYGQTGTVLTFYRRIRILGEDGLTWAQVETPILKVDFKVVDVQGRTVFRTGESVALSPDSIRSWNTRNAFNDKVKKKTFTLPAVTDDCIIEYVIKYETETASSPWMVQKDIPLLSGELRWLPFNFLNRFGWSVSYYRSAGYMRQRVDNPSYFWKQLPPRPPKRYPYVEDTTELLFDVKNVAPFQAEPFALSDQLLRGRLWHFYDLNRLPIVYWSSQSRFLQEHLNETACQASHRVSKLAADIAAIASEEARFETLYCWLRDSLVNTSLFNLDKELRRRGSTWSQEHEEKFNETIEELVECCYGRDFVIGALFRKLLLDMGFDAKLVYVPDRRWQLFDRELKLWQLHGALVAVFDSTGAARFFSPGDPFLQPGQLPWYHEGVPGLVEGPDGQFITTSYSDKEIHQMTGTYDIVIGEDRSARSQVEFQLTGSMAREARLLLLRAESDSSISALDSISARYGPGFVFDSLQVLNLAERNQPLNLAGVVRFAAPAPADTALWLVPNDYMTDYTNPFTHDKRTNQIVFEVAHGRHEVVQFAFPSGCTATTIPSDSIFYNSVGSCSIQFIPSVDKLAVARKFALNSPVWEVEDYGKVRALFQARQDMSLRAIQVGTGAPEPGTQPAVGDQ